MRQAASLTQHRSAWVVRELCSRTYVPDHKSDTTFFTFHFSLFLDIVVFRPFSHGGHAAFFASLKGVSLTLPAVKNLLLSLLLLACLRPLDAQADFPFPTDSAEWIVYKVYGIIGPEDYFVVYRDFVSGQDSVFEGKTYSVAWRQDLCSCTCVTPGYLPVANQTPFILGGIREEDGKVFFTVFGGDGATYFRPVHDTLLFDFTAQAGDTLPYGDKQLAVTDVTEDMDGRRTVHLKILPLGVPRTWVEGQGSAGLLETLEWFNQNGSCFGNAMPSTCNVPCEVVTAIADPYPDVLRLDVHPSPAMGRVTMGMPVAWPGADLYVFTPDGRLLSVLSEIAQGQTLDVSGYPPGLIILVAIDGEGRRATGRFVKR